MISFMRIRTLKPSHRCSVTIDNEAFCEWPRCCRSWEKRGSGSVPPSIFCTIRDECWSDLAWHEVVGCLSNAEDKHYRLPNNSGHCRPSKMKIILLEKMCLSDSFAYISRLSCLRSGSLLLSGAGFLTSAWHTLNNFLNQILKVMRQGYFL